MKRTILTVAATLIVVLVAMPYLIGRCNYVGAGETICFLMDDDSESECDEGWGTDGDIENILAIHNFTLVDALAYPTFTDFYMSGLLTLRNLPNWTRNN